MTGIRRTVRRVVLAMVAVVVFGAHPVNAVPQDGSVASVCRKLSSEPALALVGSEHAQAAHGVGAQFFMKASDQQQLSEAERLEDIAIQLAAADVLFRDVLGLVK